MATQETKLLVPESLKQSKVTAYREAPNVLTFEEFFADEIRKRRWQLGEQRGLVPVE